MQIKPMEFHCTRFLTKLFNLNFPEQNESYCIPGNGSTLNSHWKIQLFIASLWAAFLPIFYDDPSPKIRVSDPTKSDMRSEYGIDWAGFINQARCNITRSKIFKWILSIMYIIYVAPICASNSSINVHCTWIKSNGLLVWIYLELFRLCILIREMLLILQNRSIQNYVQQLDNRQTNSTQS